MEPPGVLAPASQLAPRNRQPSPEVASQLKRNRRAKRPKNSAPAHGQASVTSLATLLLKCHHTLRGFCYTFACYRVLPNRRATVTCERTALTIGVVVRRAAASPVSGVAAANPAPSGCPGTGFGRPEQDEGRLSLSDHIGNKSAF